MVRVRGRDIGSLNIGNVKVAGVCKLTFKVVEAVVEKIGVSLVTVMVNVKIEQSGCPSQICASIE